MASFPGLCKAVGAAEEENGELDGSLQQMLKAIADERNRLNIRQEISGLGERTRFCPLCAVALKHRVTGTELFNFSVRVRNKNIRFHVNQQAFCGPEPC